MTGNGNDCSHSRCSLGQIWTTHPSQGFRQSCRTLALDDLEDRIFAQPQPVADLSVRLAFTDELEHSGGETVCLYALAGSPAKDDTPLACGCYAGTNPLAQ
jgi:hypothetical protein